MKEPKDLQEGDEVKYMGRTLTVLGVAPVGVYIGRRKYNLISSQDLYAIIYIRFSAFNAKIRPI